MQAKPFIVPTLQSVLGRLEGKNSPQPMDIINAPCLELDEIRGGVQSLKNAQPSRDE